MMKRIDGLILGRNNNVFTLPIFVNDFLFYLKSRGNANRDSGLSFNDKNGFVLRLVRMKRTGHHLSAVVRVSLEDENTLFSSQIH